MDENKEKKRQNTVGLISTLSILVLFAIMALVLINVGVRVYKNVVLANNDNFELRTSLSFLATRVRQSDVSGMVDVKEFNGSNALVLSEDFDGDFFDTVIFFEDGKVYELSMLRGYEVDPDAAFEIMELGNLKIDKPDDNTIHFTAENNGGDSEELNVTLRSR